MNKNCHKKIKNPFDLGIINSVLWDTITSGGARGSYACDNGGRNGVAVWRD